MLTSVVIVAGGRGTRMQTGINKVYMELGGRPILARTIDAFDTCMEIDEIILVVNERDLSWCREQIIEKNKFKKVRNIVTGGVERQHSVYNGLLAVNENTNIVLIHDGARPFVEKRDILESIEAADQFGAAAVAVPVKDTIKVCDSSGFVQHTPDRKSLWAIQTPQAFRYRLILDAHKDARREGFVGTDDAVLVERAGCRMKLIEGSYTNIKITTPEDMIIGEAIGRKLK